MKTCNKCKIEKPLSEFWKSVVAKDGHVGRCKVCIKACQKQYEQRPYVKAQRKTAKANRLKHKIISDESKLIGKKRIFQKNLERAYNMTVKQHAELYEKQGGRCVTCGLHESEFNRRLCVDHCHRTGRIRGLLCFKCNTTLGLVGEKIDTLRAMIEHLSCDE